MSCRQVWLAKMRKLTVGTKHNPLISSVAYHVVSMHRCNDVAMLPPQCSLFITSDKND